MKIFTPKNGFIRLTRQYVGGFAVGFGVCAVTMAFFVHSQGARIVEMPLLFPLLVTGGFCLMAVGGSLALAEQRRLDSDRKP